MADLITRPNWLSSKGELRLDAFEGKTIGECIGPALVSRIQALGAVCAINGTPIEDWIGYKISADDHILLSTFPAGSTTEGSSRANEKRMVTMVAMIAVAVATGGSGLPLLAKVAINVSASLVMGLVNNALIKPPSQSTSGELVSDPFFTFSGSGNAMNPWGTVARVYGTMRVTPALLLPPSLEAKEQTDFLIQLFDFGHGELEFKAGSEKIGENDLTDIVGDNKGEGVIHYAPYKTSDKFKWLDKLRQGISWSPGTVIIPNTALYSTVSGSSTGVDMSLATASHTIPRGSSSADVRLSIPQLFRFVDGDYSEFNIGIGLELSTDGGATYTSDLRSAGITLAVSDESIVFKDRSYTAWAPIPAASIGTSVLPDSPKGFTFLPFAKKYVYAIVEIAGQYATLRKPAVVGPNSGEMTFLDGYVIPSTYSGRSFRYRAATHSDGFSYLFFYGTWRLPKRQVLTFYGLDESKEYKIRMQRWMGANDLNKDFAGSVYLESLTYVSATKPSIHPIVPHTIAEMRVKATDELSGAIQQYSAIVSSKLHSWIKTGPQAYTMQAKAVTSNPAWVFCAVLTDDCYRKAIPLTDLPKRVNMDDMIAWAAECDTLIDGKDKDGNTIRVKRYTCNLQISADTTTLEVLQTVASTGRASPAMRDGQITVIRESASKTPVQLVTPKNSRNFSAALSYSEPAEGLHVQFFDEEDDYKRAQITVKRDDSKQIDESKLEDLTLAGTTNYSQAYKFGKYFIAEAVLRRERASFDMDIENLVAQRGDIVRVAHDVLDVGGAPLRVVKIAGTAITVDEGLPSGNSIRVRGSDLIQTVTQIDAYTFSVPVIGNITVGTLLEYGTLTSNAADYVVDSVIPSSDLSASISVIEHRPEILDSDTLGIPDRVPFPGGSNAVSQIGPVQYLAYDLDETVVGRVRYFTPVLRWEPPSLGFADHYAVYEKTNYGNVLLGRADSTRFVTDLIAARLIKNPTAKTFSVVAVSAADKKSLESVIVVPLHYDRKPTDVTGFGSNILTSTIHLFWHRVWDEDLDHYEIRYSPSFLTTATWGNSTFVTKEAAYDQTSITTPARTGTYFIKGVDTAGNYSKVAGATVTHVDTLPQLDLYHTYVFNPFVGGVHQNTELLGGKLTLKDGEKEGWWFSPDKIDFGARDWTARLIAQIDMGAYTPDEHLDQPYFTPLSTAKPLSPASAFVDGQNYLDAQIYYLRDKDIKEAVLADPYFSPLASADPLDSTYNVANDALWTRLIATDIKTNMTRFAIKLTTTLDHIRPITVNASVIADWHERVERGSDISVPQAGLDVAFQYAFAPISGSIKKPSVGVSLQNASPGDTVAVFPHPTLPENEGFTVKVFDSSNAAKAGEIDWQALGVGQGY